MSLDASGIACDVSGPEASALPRPSVPPRTLSSLAELLGVSTSASA